MALTVKKHSYWYVLIDCDVFRGAVLGLAAHSPTNTGALCITFGSPSLGFADALGRVFTSVGCFNFNPFYRCKEEPILVDQDPVGVVSVLCTEESINRNQNKLLHDAEEIWIRRPGRETTTVKTGFILVGPITQDSNIATANLLIHFLKQAELLEPKAKLVSVRPMEIENTNVKKVFKEYTPPDDYFSRDGIAVDVQKSGDEPLKWAVEEKSSDNPADSAPAQGNTADSAPAQGNTANSVPNKHLLQLKAGDVPGKFQFYLYKLKDVTVHV